MSFLIKKLFIFWILSLSLFKLMGQDLVVTALESKKYDLGEFLLAQVIYKNIEQAQIDKIRKLTNKKITKNLLIVSVDNIGPPDSFTFVITYDGKFESFEVDGIKINVIYENFILDENAQNPPFNFTFKMSGKTLTTKDYFYIYGSIVIFLFLLALLIYLRKRSLKKKSFLSKANEWKDYILNTAKVDKESLSFVYINKKEWESFLQFEEKKYHNFITFFYEIKFKKEWKDEETGQLQNLYSDFQKTIEVKRWNT